MCDCPSETPVCSVRLACFESGKKTRITLDTAGHAAKRLALGHLAAICLCMFT
jgi:hypothetical protein